MNRLRHRLTVFLRSEEGPTAVEYAVMFALVLVAIIGTVSALGLNPENMFDTFAATIASM